MSRTGEEVDSLDVCFNKLNGLLTQRLSYINLKRMSLDVEENIEEARNAHENECDERIMQCENQIDQLVQLITVRLGDPDQFRSQVVQRRIAASDIQTEVSNFRKYKAGKYDWNSPNTVEELLTELDGILRPLSPQQRFAQLNSHSPLFALRYIEATEEEKVTIAQFLIKNGADADACNTYHTESLLSRCVEQGDEVLCRVLIQHGASVDRKVGMHRETPLHISARRANRSISRMLLHAGANPYELNGRDRMPLDVARKPLARSSREMSQVFENMHDDPPPERFDTDFVYFAQFEHRAPHRLAFEMRLHPRLVMGMRPLKSSITPFHNLHETAVHEIHAQTLDTFYRDITFNADDAKKYGYAGRAYLLCFLGTLGVDPPHLNIRMRELKDPSSPNDTRHSKFTTFSDDIGANGYRTCSEFLRKEESLWKYSLFRLPVNVEDGSVASEPQEHAGLPPLLCTRISSLNNKQTSIEFELRDTSTDKTYYIQFQSRQPAPVIIGTAVPDGAKFETIENPSTPFYEKKYLGGDCWQTQRH